jgi:hypothetical protein
MNFGGYKLNVVQIPTAKRFSPRRVMPENPTLWGRLRWAPLARSLDGRDKPSVANGCMAEAHSHKYREHVHDSRLRAVG